MPHVRIEPLIAECRIFYNDNPKSDEQYQLSMNLLYLRNEPGAVFISMLTARMPNTKAVLKEIVRTLLQMGIHTVYATRAEGHILPRAEKLPNNTWKLDLTKFKSMI